MDQVARHPRAPLELRVDYTRMNMFFADYTKNISKGGTFIRTPTPLPLGTRFVFRLGVPGLSQPLELGGIVVWTIDGDHAVEAGKDPGMGVRFLFRDEADMKRIEAIVEKLMVDSLGEGIYRQLVNKGG